MPDWASPGCYLAAAAAIIVAAAAVVAVGVATAAAAEQQNQNDNPPAVVATKAIITTHKEYLQINSQRFYRSFQGIPLHKKGAAKSTLSNLFL